MSAYEEAVWPEALRPETDVDAHGVPMAAFGAPAPPLFFEILGRIIAVHGRIEYLEERLDHLPSTEETGSRKGDQFASRCREESAARNTLVHSLWVFGADATDPDVLLALRYKRRKQTSGSIATVSITSVPQSGHEQDVSRYTMEDLERVLRTNVVTMRIGELAYTERMSIWAAKQIEVESPLA